MRFNTTRGQAPPVSFTDALFEGLAPDGGLYVPETIEPWTAEYVAMRALGDSDAWLPTDLGVRRALVRVGATARDADRWRPHRTHAVRHLWAAS